MNIGEVIKQRRQKRNITQADLAELLNVTPQAVSRWETDAGMPDIQLLPAISTYFGVSIDALEQQIAALAEQWDIRTGEMMAFESQI